MGTFPLNPRNIQRIKSMLETQVYNASKRFAKEAYYYFTHFYYNVNGGMELDSEGGGWTLYYVSNWNISVNGIDTSVFPAEREIIKDKYKSNIDYTKAENFLRDKTSGMICVTNSVYYGSTLNNGGVLESGITTVTVKPNRFVERCNAHLINNSVLILKGIEKECPDL